MSMSMNNSISSGSRIHMFFCKKGNGNDDSGNLLLCISENIMAFTSLAFALLIQVPYLFYLARQKRPDGGNNDKEALVANTKLIFSLVFLTCCLLQIIGAVFCFGGFIFGLISATTVSVIVLVATLMERRKFVAISFVLFWIWLQELFSSSFRLVIAFIFQHQNAEVQLLRLTLAGLSFASCLLQTIIYGFIGRHRQVEKGSNPIVNASILSTLTMSWMTPLLLTGWRKPLVVGDLWRLPEGEETTFSSSLLQNSLDRIFKKNRSQAEDALRSQEIEERIPLLSQNCDDYPPDSGRKNPAFALFLSLMQAFGGALFLSSFLFFVHNCIYVAQPLLMNLIIENMEGKWTTPNWYGYFLASVFVSTCVLQHVFINYFFVLATRIALQVKSALSIAVFNKCLRLSNASRQAVGGHVISLIAVDAFVFVFSVPLLAQSWAMILLTVACFALLWVFLGIAALVAIGMMIVVAVLVFIASQVAKKYQIEKLKKTDERLRSTNEMLNGIKAIKLEVLEETFQNQINQARNAELRVLKKEMILLNVSNALWTVAPSLVQILTFMAAVSSHVVLDPSTVFTVITILNVMQFPLKIMPYAVAHLVQTVVSLKRLGEFLQLEEVDEASVSRNVTNNVNSVSVRNGTFCWNNNNTPVLRNISFQVKPGQLVAIVGDVGSGKSSILSALIGDMVKEHGEVVVNGTCGYVAQTAWIQNATVKENILFSSDEDTNRLQKIIEACSLASDLEIFPDGDATEIGERGVTLSGGQKQRIALARAVYANADVYLLDDALSAVDAHTARHLIDHVIGPRGLLAKQTRICATHRLNFLPQCDAIILLENGEIKMQGTFRELIHTETFRALLCTKTDMTEDNDDFVDIVSQECGEEFAESISLSRRSRILSESKSIHENIENRTKTMGEVSGERQTKIMDDESMKHGQIASGVLASYIKAMGVSAFLLLFIFLAVSQTSSVGSQDYLSQWSNQFVDNATEAYDSAPQTFSIIGALVTVEAIGVTTAMIILALGTVKAAAAIQERLLALILQGRMAFFESTPVARIINRFSKDMDIIDSKLRENLSGVARYVVQALGALVIITVKLPVFLLVGIPLFIVYLCIRTIFVATSRQLIRIESVAHSPVLYQISEVVNGISTIRAFQKQSYFHKKFLKVVDDSQIALFADRISILWLFLTTGIIGVCVVFATAFLGIIQRDELNAGAFALALTYSLLIPDMLTWIVRYSSQAETNMIAVERVFEYFEIPKEAEWSRPSQDKDLEQWPGQGEIIFENVQLRYRKNHEPAIRGLSFAVRPKEKIGIVGRTGAGKSSLHVALLRIVELEQGRIRIDGVDIHEIGIHPLRRAIIAVPQDCVLFSGTLRFNLDPGSLHTDEEIIHSLNLVNMQTWLASEAGGLDFRIAEHGENLSVGQRQLICMARALLRRHLPSDGSAGTLCGKILLMDEATAAVDVNSDRIITKVVQSEFKDATVLTIAHRLDTVITCDRILVLGNGKVLEFDSPANLLSNTSSQFYKMASEAGLTD